MAADQKSRWTKEIDWLLSVSDHIVEFVPSRQVAENGTCMEVKKIPLFQYLLLLYYSSIQLHFQFVIQQYSVKHHCVNQLKLTRFHVKQIMITQQRQDLQMNIPALRKLDAMLLVSTGMLYLDNLLN